LQSSAIVIRCRLSVTLVYCDKTTANRITWFALQSSYWSTVGKFDNEI